MKVYSFTGAAAILLASTQIPYAIPITGNIGITGGLSYNTSSSATATAVTRWISPYVTLDSGVFAAPSIFAIPLGTAAIMAPVVWNFNTVTPINGFWSVGGFTFQLTSSAIAQQGGAPGVTGYVDVDGTGLVSGNGYTATPMSWIFTAQDPTAGHNPDSWTFSAAGATPGIPDGGSTAILLGFALSGAAWLKKKAA